VTLEVTEGYMIQNPKRTRQSIEQLKTLGVRIALDDFGSGFSSIGYLRQFGFDRIKIDRSLVMDIQESDSQREMLKATVALARSLDIPVTAEGIETGAGVRRAPVRLRHTAGLLLRQADAGRTDHRADCWTHAPANQAHGG
jgi:EAL domain-containing protein (putative c-di-GMP-specific phosphodiesterase class I)